MVNVNFKKTSYTSDELREVMQLIEIQESNERYENVELSIDGNFAKIEVEFDDMGDITVL